MSYPLKFEVNHQMAVCYHRQLLAQFPNAPHTEHNNLDCKLTVLGREYSVPPCLIPNSNKQMIDTFIEIINHKYLIEDVHVYKSCLFDRLFHNHFGLKTLSGWNYIKKFYELFSANDYALVQKKVLVFPIQYGFAWHLVVVDQPLNAIKEGKKVNVYFVTTHSVLPQNSLSLYISKYIEMAFAVLDLKAFSNNFHFHQRLLEDFADQSHVLCALYIELACKMQQNQKDMALFFSAIKPQVQEFKFERFIYASFMQTMLNRFDTKTNPHGQICNFNVAMIEKEDLVWESDYSLKRDPTEQNLAYLIQQSSPHAKCLSMSSWISELELKKTKVTAAVVAGGGSDSEEELLLDEPFASKYNSSTPVAEGSALKNVPSLF